MRRFAVILLCLGMGSVLIFLGAVSRNFWQGDHLVALTVQAHKLATAQAPLSTFVDSPVGAYLTGTHGTLLYRTTSFWDHLLLYRLGNLSLVEALFGFGIGLYLFCVVRRLRVGQEFTAPLRRAITVIGSLAVVLPFSRTLWDQGIQLVFEQRMQHLFFLHTPPTSNLPLLLGLVLLLCAQLLRRGEALQADASGRR
jgi:hypothetical protein